jgi:VTC domain-containing protein
MTSSTSGLRSGIRGPVALSDWEGRLAGLPVASHELILARDLLRRTDLKFILAPGEAADLLPALEAEYARLTTGNGPVAVYRSLYFDTPDLAFFHAHRRGRRVRHKVRVRHYPDRQLSMLEIKTRRSGLETRKIWVKRDYGDDTLRPADQEFVRAHTGVDRDVLPQAWTRFRRATLLGLSASERVTIDFDLELSWGGRSRTLDAVAIVEVKQWPFLPGSPVLTALRRAGKRPGWASKYCAAIAFTRRNVRANALLPGLRALERRAA